VIVVVGILFLLLFLAIETGQAISNLSVKIKSMDASLAHLTAAVEAADNKLESVAGSVVDLRGQVTALQLQIASGNPIAPADLEALAAKLDATVSDVESKLGASALVAAEPAPVAS
jgi:peptidoglycan hydrolase CwlO-like protein